MNFCLFYRAKISNFVELQFVNIFFFFFFNFIYLFIIIINFWLCWVFVSARGLPPAAASGGHPSSRCAGLSPSWPLPLRSTGSRCAGSVIVAHGPSRSAACGILPDQGSNPCPLHWQADSQPLRHQGSPSIFYGLYFCQTQGHENLLPRFLLKVLWFYILHTYDTF